jgi:phosphocarrier protein FPr
LCGEIAGDSLAVSIILGLGVDELSANPPAIPAIKRTIARLTLADAKDMAKAALDMDSPEEIRQYVAGRLQPGTLP